MADAAPLVGRVAIVTGGSRGIGHAVALGLAHQGANVLVGYHADEAAARATVAAIEALGREAIAVRADVAVEAECRATVAAAVARWQRVDVVINNAGAGAAVAHEQLDELTEEIWDRTFAVNLKGAFWMTRAAATALRAARGVVVNVSSFGGRGSSSIAYSASKAALDDLTRSLARVLAPEVRVNGVAPGFIATDRMRDRFGDRYEVTRDWARARTLLDTYATPEHVARVVVSLVKDLDWVTGQTLIADGGSGVK